LLLYCFVDRKVSILLFPISVFVINLIILSATNIAKNEQKDFQKKKKLPSFKLR